MSDTVRHFATSRRFGQLAEVLQKRSASVGERDNSARSHFGYPEALDDLSTSADLMRRSLEILANGLHPAAQVTGKERLDDGIEGDVVLRAVKAVALVGKDYISDGNLLFLHSCNDQFALSQCAPHVISSVADQHGLFDLVDLVEWRARAQEGPPLLCPHVGVAAI